MSTENGNGTTVGFGLTTWDENNLGKRDFTQKEPLKVSFARLKDGNNKLRIVTEPHKYFSVRVKAPNERGHGKKVNTAWPKHADCPAKAAGLKPKKRYLVGVIDRNDNEVKVLDMSLTVYDQIKGICEGLDGNAKPTDFDVNIRVNSKGSATNYYQVLKLDSAPLSPADVELKNSKMEDLEQALVHFSTPPSPEVVAKRLQKFGFVPGSEDSAEATADETSGGLRETEDDDYSFPSASAQA